MPDDALNPSHALAPLRPAAGGGYLRENQGGTDWQRSWRPRS